MILPLFLFLAFGAASFIAGRKFQQWRDEEDFARSTRVRRRFHVLRRI